MMTQYKTYPIKEFAPIISYDRQHIFIEGITHKKNINNS